MSGHSKWSTIKRKKGELDNIKSKYFTKIVKEITVAVKQGGPDVNSNPRLYTAIQNAKGVNMPKANIERAINNVSNDQTTYYRIIYECNWTKGVTFMVECLTDNKNRTVGDVRSIITRNNGSLGKEGSVSYNYNKKSYFKIESEDNKSIDDDFQLELIDSGCDDIDNSEEGYLHITGADDSFGQLQNLLMSKKMNIIEARLIFIPINTIELSPEDEDKAIDVIEKLEDLDDVQYVYHNIQIKNLD